MMKLSKYFLLISMFSISTFTLSNEEFTILTDSKIVTISSNNWIKMQDSESYAKNFEQKIKPKSHRYARVITIFLLPMSTDRQLGMKISNNEYLEFFITSLGYVTAQTRMDKGDHWILCRETFLPKETRRIDIGQYKPLLSAGEGKQLWALYQSEIDATRYIMKSEF